MSQDQLNLTTRFKREDTQVAAGVAGLTIFDSSTEPVKVDLASFGKHVITFGRGEDNDIRLRSRYVGRRPHGHFRLYNGQWIIEDLNSTNGLIYEGKTIKSKILSDGDQIRIDDGVETTVDGLLMVFSQDNASEWKTIDISSRMVTTIGRNSTCDITLDHVSVSKVHAQITKKGKHYYIEDCGSTNGMLINGIKAENQRRLSEKDVILITNSQLIYGNGTITYCCFKKGISVDALNIVKRVDKNRKTICNDVSLSIKPCELVAIVGGSGAGKSTVMNCISGYSMPTEGSVAINGIELYENFDALKNIIGYVPQQDIVFDNLTVQDMLGYAAKLRLPADLSAGEYESVIKRAITIVELMPHKDKLIKNLSGGQKKRASIAVELLSDPNLFFLDEPASGLDPGTERNLMKTLKSMALSGKTVVFVTHSTLNLHLCDRIVFMGAGGNLCFYGSYEEALAFFAIDDVVDVYNMITDRPLEYMDKYQSTQKSVIKPPVNRNQEVSKDRKRHSRTRQFTVLSKRHLHIMRNDRVRMLLIILQAPLLAFLISLVANGQQFEQYEMTKSLLFAMACSAFWIGILNSIQEICKERVILKREYMTGLRLDSYILSKLFVMGIVCAIQSFLLTTVFVLLVGQPDTGVVFGAYFELLTVTFLTALAASATGIFVSSLFKNADRAMTVAPILLMPQLLFSGLIFTLEGASELISWIAVCRFTMEGYGTTANLNDLPTRLQQEGFPIEREVEDFFTFTGEHFAFALGMLCLFVVIYSLTAGVVLRGIKRD
jgi:ABC-type multidrug transport system ATPase subunit